jgi:hypothetical protein
VVANLAGTIPLKLTIDGHVRESESSYRWAAGGHVLTIFTVLPELGIALELISTYIGERRTGTVATHLTLGPVDQSPRLWSHRQEPGALDPGEQPRACVYDHTQQLLDTLAAAGLSAGVEVDEVTFGEIEHV